MNKIITFGYLYDFRNPPQWRKPWAEFYAELLDFMVWTESAGFGGIWVPEHHGAEDGYLPSPLTMLAAVAARTRTIKLGSAVALAPLYNPVRFAEDCAIIDILSNGRLEMAIAVGYRQRETDAIGVPFNTRGSRTDEFIEIVRRLWAGETVTHESRHFSIRDAKIMPLPLKGNIPLYIGGFSQKALMRAARLGDGYHGKIEGFASYVEKLRECGKDPASARLREHDLNFFVARDPDAAWEELGPYMLYMHETYAQWMSENQADYDLGDNVDVLLKSMTLDEFKASGNVRIMTPKDAIAHIEGMLERAPVEHFMMFVPPGLPLARFREYAELFAHEVMPAFQADRVIS